MESEQELVLASSARRPPAPPVLSLRQGHPPNGQASQSETPRAEPVTRVMSAVVTLRNCDADCRNEVNEISESDFNIIHIGQWYKMKEEQ